MMVRKLTAIPLCVPFYAALAFLLLILSTSQVTGQGRTVEHFRATLSGGEEVPPVDTMARGTAIFNLSDDGTELNYRLNVANIEFVTQAHIHLAPAGQNGSVVAFLFGFEPEGVIVNGTLAVGTITEADLVGPLAGQSLDALVDEIVAGNTYVNVHTQEFPAGEIRGQIF